MPAKLTPEESAAKVADHAFTDAGGCVCKTYGTASMIYLDNDGNLKIVGVPSEDMFRDFFRLHPDAR